MTVKFIAMTVRNAMEDYHCEHLSDSQMKELNPIIRNAIASALYAMSNQGELWSDEFVKFQMMLVPDYWEEPQINEDLLRTIEYFNNPQNHV